MLRVGTRRLAATALLMFLSGTGVSGATAADREICDVPGDLVLRLENYSAAVMLHRRHLRSHPNDTLAHYHLGFAYRMIGRDAEEINEYLAAVKLGLEKWDLFLNLGLAYLGQHEFAQATAVLQTAVLLGPEHAEAHFNLAIPYERQNRLGEALREITASRRPAPEDLDAGNTNAIICAEMDDLSCAHDVWTHLLQTAPDYFPARSNLAMLSRWFTRTGQSKRHPELQYSQPGITGGHTVGNQLFDVQVAKVLR